MLASRVVAIGQAYRDRIEMVNRFTILVREGNTSAPAKTASAVGIFDMPTARNLGASPRWRCNFCKFWAPRFSQIEKAASGRLVAALF